MKNILNKYISDKTWNSLQEIIVYLFVGGVATLVEWAGFWLFFDIAHIQYLVATSIAFMISTAANWILGRMLVFKARENQSIWKELAAIYAASVAGLLFNLIIMFIMVQFFGIHEMISKMTATVIVFSYNFLIRKLVIYKKK